MIYRNTTKETSINCPNYKNLFYNINQLLSFNYKHIKKEEVFRSMRRKIGAIFKMGGKGISKMGMVRANGEVIVLRF